MIICGIDYSMTSPALCIGEENCLFENNIFYGFRRLKRHISTKKEIVLFDYPLYKTNEERFDKISDLMIETILLNKVDLCRLEGYSLGSKGMIFDIAENTAVLKHKLYKNNINFELIPPKSVKLSFTGRGDCSKGVMYMFFRDKHCPYEIHHAIGDMDVPAEIDHPIEDLIDAYALKTYIPPLKKKSKKKPS